jgi:hypothetical protein
MKNTQLGNHTMKNIVSIALLSSGLALLGVASATAAPLPTSTLALLAAGERASVLTETTDNTTTSHNGSEWYLSPGQSMGFAYGGTTVQLESADVKSGDQDWARLSWHLGYIDIDLVDYIKPGYRLGETTDLNYDDTTGRFIFSADTLPAYYPSGPQENVVVSDLDGWTLCWSDLYGDGFVDTVDSIWAACDGAYLMFAGGAVAADNGGSGPEGLAPTGANSGANSGGIIGTAVSLIAAGMIVAIRRRKA